MSLDPEERGEAARIFLDHGESFEDELKLGAALVAVLTFRWKMTPRAVAALLVKDAPSDQEFISGFKEWTKALRPEEAPAGELPEKLSILGQHIVGEINFGDDSIVWQPKSVYLGQEITQQLSDAVDQILENGGRDGS